MSVSPLVLTAMAGCLRDLPATGWHNQLAASLFRNLKSRGQRDLRSQSSPPRVLAASSDGSEVEVVRGDRSELRYKAGSGSEAIWRPTLWRAECGGGAVFTAFRNAFSSPWGGAMQ